MLQETRVVDREAPTAGGIHVSATASLTSICSRNSMTSHVSCKLQANSCLLVLSAAAGLGTSLSDSLYKSRGSGGRQKRCNTGVSALYDLTCACVQATKHLAHLKASRCGCLPVSICDAHDFVIDRMLVTPLP